MYRVILILGLLVVLYFLLRKALRGLKGQGQPERLAPGKDQMVQDPVCLVFVPRGTAVAEYIGGANVLLLQSILRTQVSGKTRGLTT